uniref:RNA-directed DNA polymerase n=1 Tax=Meloidogyne enterolobii TaxID=390850 RepID=A0A6V7WB79_MELEN|nr:unnamed protein product [Meloidogyne enterolobii]
MLKVEQVDEVNIPHVNAVHTAEISEFFEKDNKDAEEKSVEDKSGLVGKIIALRVNVLGKEALSIVDPGAQISLVNAGFLVNLLKSNEIKLNDSALKFSKSAEQVLDVNGNKVNSLGVVNLPIKRNGMNETLIRAHITKAPFGYELLFGTNCLKDLGFKLYDEPNDEMINFQEAERQKSGAVKIIFHTTIPPRSTKLVETRIDKEFEGKEILIAQNEESGIRIEPTLGCGEKGKVVVPVTNTSELPIRLKENESIGKVETVNQYGEAENFLYFDWDSKDVKVNFVGGTTLDSSAEQKERKDEFKLQLEKNTGKLKENQYSELIEIVNEFEEIFALRDEELTQTNLVKHEIHLENNQPIRSRLRPVPFAYREKIAAMLQDYLGRGIVRPSHSPYASPIVIVPKKDGSLRFCVDYRGIISVTEKDAFPLPNIDNTLLMLGNKRIFSTLDFMSGYWQIKMEEDSINKTAFITEFGLHEFLVMPFGLANAVATFQRFMSILFEDLINDFVFVYIDDILIASNSFDEHKKHLKMVFERIKMAGLKLKISKCKFAAEEIPFLGHTLTPQGIKKDAEKIKPVLDLPIPKTKKELRSLLGFMTYYRKFIYSFGAIAKPLFQLVREDAVFKIGEKEKEAIQTLKEKIIKDVLLYFPDFESAVKNPKRAFIIMTDASKIGLSAVLCQPDENDKIRPIYFASRQCNKHEERYCPTELEALAVRFGAKKFAQFITMIPTRVLTDHKALVPMFKSKNETGNSRVDRWIMELNARFILKVEYNPGKSNTVADLLSRIPPPQSKTIQLLQIDKEANEKEVENCLGVEKGRKIDWIEKTRESEFKGLYEFLEKRILPNDQNESQSIIARCQNVILNDGLLYFVDKEGELKLFVPREFRKELLEERHEGVCAGHQSGKKLFRQLNERYFWPNMRAECNTIALNCRICSHARKARVNQPELQMRKTSEPLELVCLDVLEIGKSNASNRYVLVIVDHFTKWVVAEPIPDKSSETIARVFVEKFVLMHGTPKQIHSDQGKEFISKTTTLGYDPNANGLVERINQIILGMLKRNTGSVWDWDLRLPFCVFAINITPSESTGYSPYHLMFGRTVNFPSSESIQFPVNPAYTIDEDTYLQLFRENLTQLIAEANKNLEKSREKIAAWYNAKKNVSGNKYKIGDRVMVNFPGKNIRNEHKKLLWNNFGPYKIISMGKASAECIPTDNPKAKSITVPIERLTKVPPGVPNIATLPTGKNPYKNIINLMTMKINIEEKNHGTIFLLGVEAIKFDWTTFCSKNEEHSECKILHASDLDPVLDETTKIGKLEIKTALQALFTIFLLKKETTNSLTAAKALLSTILKGDPGFELILFSGKRGDLVTTGKMPNEKDIFGALEKWVNSCKVLKKKLEKGKYEEILVETTKSIEGLPNAEKEEWKSLIKKTSWVLEKVRAKIVFEAKKFIEKPRLLIGDSTAEQLFNAMPGSEIVGKEGNISEIIRALNGTVLSSKVKGALIIVGRDSLLNGETAESIAEQINRLITLIKDFKHVRIFVMAPPYVHRKSEEFNELYFLIKKLSEKNSINFVSVTENGRSIVEIFRKGTTFNDNNVTITGQITNIGLSLVRSWLFTQVPDFPGDQQIGRLPPTVNSQIVIPDKRHERTSGGGLGDRISFRRSPYRHSSSTSHYSSRRPSTSPRHKYSRRR